MNNFKRLVIICLPFLFIFSGCGDEQKVTYKIPECPVGPIDTVVTEESFDPSSAEYKEKFLDSILGEKDTVTFINPTGVYHSGPYTPEGADEPVGMQGDVRVKYLGNSKVAICLNYVSHGPGFNVGYLFDTLEYRNNTVAYHNSLADESCTVTFRFKNDGVDVEQFSQTPDFACDFGHNVYVNGFYRKESDEILNIDDDCY